MAGRSVAVARLVIALVMIVAWNVGAPTRLYGQETGGRIAGRITDTAGHPVVGVIAHVMKTFLGTRTLDDGIYRISNVPAGSYILRFSAIGYAVDSITISVAAGAVTTQDMQLRPILPASLERVLVSTNRSGESKAAALDRQKSADNIVTVLSGDEIRALPNANAAEAAGRIPGVAIERDEGEGKFVQIRGTEPRLSNVTIDGIHVPGTEQGDRIPKLDDVPSDLLAAIEVSKTLTADMDADAIGGSVNLVTKTPEGAPHGYVSGQFGQITLLNHVAGQGGFTYGGRVGDDQKLGFLIGASADRNDRVINDVEPSWGVDSTGRSYPNDWNQRDYTYYRTRYGVGGDLDYRFSDQSTVYLRGLYSLFLNHGIRYVYDVSPANDSAGVGSTGYGTGVQPQRQSSNRTPTEQMYGLTAGAKRETGPWVLDYALNYSGTSQVNHNYRSSTFDYSGDTPLAVRYNANPLVPTYQFATSAMASAAADPANYLLGGYDYTQNATEGHDMGGAINALFRYTVGGDSGAFKFGAKIRDEQKHFTDNSQSFDVNSGTSIPLTQALGNFSDPHFYSMVSNSYSIAPVPDNDVITQFEDSHPADFTNTTDSMSNQLGSFSGAEKIYAGYAMNTTNVGAFRLNVGLRLETTQSSYVGHIVLPNSLLGGATGSRSYTDLFPSAQVRYAVDDNTNLRVAVTRAIARPNYSDLAPSVNGTIDVTAKNDPSNLSVGNPDLRAEHSWNYDLLAEHFLPQFGGVISGGVFYKQLTDLILTQDFVYQGTDTVFNGYAAQRQANGGSGHLLGVEANWAQHLPFLPGLLSGLGFDANYTHVDSRAVVDLVTMRQAPLLRQAPNLANVALTYDLGRVSSRVAWTYNGPDIDAYGDGTATAGGDNYFYSHSQIDGSVIYSVTRTSQIQFQVLNINNAPFGFFQGSPAHAYNFQREFYGQTFYLGAKYGI